ncbi:MULTISPECIES: SUKH-3 domain-containing protein [unclassified Duganella]|uniref:SUKH-3 domain-containing protein n=1 Tax=unclassified Duganella TaxID=2636909 RepID=UPI0011C0D600|nr:MULTISPECIES: SUKH-3 domain-containing protein [unclassified Duganella]
MFELSEIVCPYFKEAGWKPEWDDPMPLQTLQDRAMVLLRQFGGLRVGSEGPGIEGGRGDVCFYTQLRPATKQLLAPWMAQTGEVEAIATAHGDHIIVYTGTQNFYAYTDPDEQLYDLGPDFSSAMEKLLLGLSYGFPLVGTPA